MTVTKVFLATERENIWYQTLLIIEMLRDLNAVYIFQHDCLFFWAQFLNDLGWLYWKKCNVHPKLSECSIMSFTSFCHFNLETSISPTAQHLFSKNTPLKRESEIHERIGNWISTIAHNLYLTWSKPTQSEQNLELHLGHTVYENGLEEQVSMPVNHCVVEPHYLHKGGLPGFPSTLPSITFAVTYYAKMIS